MELKQPKTNTQEILWQIIHKGNVSIMDFPYLSGFRTRISELKNYYGIGIKRQLVTKRNKFGNAYRYAVHTADKFTRHHATLVYKAITEPNQ